MQLIILTYQMTGASQVVSDYMFLQVLVSSYLFLNGFVHFQLYWSQQQQQQPHNVTRTKSVVRFFTVITYCHMFEIGDVLLNSIYDVRVINEQSRFKIINALSKNQKRAILHLCNILSMSQL